MKVLTPNGKADLFEAKSGAAGIIARRWIPNGTMPSKLPVVWFKGVPATNCAAALASASRFEGFSGIVRASQNGKYGAKFAC